MKPLCRTLATALLAFCMCMFFACSSTNENQLEGDVNGVIANLGFDPQTGMKTGMQFGWGRTSFRMTPLAKGQGMKSRTITLQDGKPIHATEYEVYPVGQDAIVKISRKPEPWFKIGTFEIGSQKGNLDLIEIYPVADTSPVVDTVIIVE